MGLRNLTIGQKIALGFAVILILFAGVVGTSVINANRVGTAMDLSDQATGLVLNVMQALEAEKNYLIHGTDLYVSHVEQHVNQAMSLLTGIRNQTTDNTLLAELRRADTRLKDFYAAFKQLLNNTTQMNAERARLNQIAHTILTTIADDIRADIERRQNMTFITGVALNPAFNELTNMAGLLAIGLMEARMHETAFYYGNDEGYLAPFYEKMQYCNERRGELSNLARIVRDDKMQQAANLIEKNLVDYEAAFDGLLKLWREGVQINERIQQDGAGVIQIARNMASSYEQNLTSAKDLLIFLALILLIVGLVIGIGFAYLIVRSTGKALGSVVDQLTDGSEQITAAASEISSASHSLAEGASQQAASIEETSASLEEMSSMTRRNADNARQADGIMAETAKDMQSAGEAMHQLTNSMQEITQASEETSKIVKTIDEIAFQTNLLALNAAVEAARAGEAGAGFAVVADEVRNLALRAGEAARNTAALIESTVKKVGSGARLATDTNAAFEKVIQSSEKISSLVAEIAAASGEQAQGIEQVNTAVVDMDKVIQQTAANAEEAASSAEEMHAQAEQLNAMVAELAKLIGRKTRSLKAVRDADWEQGRGAEPAENAPPVRPQAASLRPKPRHKAAAVPKDRQKVVQKGHRKKEVKPEELIPFDEDELKHF